MGFRLPQKSMTLNDLERKRNGRLLSVFLSFCMITVNVRLFYPRACMYRYGYTERRM